jgi:hypothetical protein
MTKGDGGVFIGSDNYYVASYRLKNNSNQKEILEDICQFVDLQVLKKM